MDEPPAATASANGTDQLLNGPGPASQVSIKEMVTAFHAVRAALADLFALLGADPNKTRESAAILGLNRGLAWRLSRVVRASDPAGAISEVPGPQSMARLLGVCRERGLPKSQIERAASVFEQFERAVASCTGDRKTLAMLVANQRGDAAQGEQERARRRLYEGAAGVWGAQAQTRFVTVFVYPSRENPAMLDAAHITGFVGFRRLSDRSWPLSYEAVHGADGTARRLAKIPLDSTGSTEGQLQLIKDFCEPREPDIRVRETGDYKRFELGAGPVGNQSLSTVVFGSLLPGIYPRYSKEPDTVGFMVLLQTPIERVVFDLFLHRDLHETTPPRAQLIDRLTYPYANREADFDEQSLPLSEQAVPLAGGFGGALCPHMAFYPRMLSMVTERIGAPIDAFVGSRFEMTYPPVATILSRRFDLRPPPGGASGSA
ncbi:MAG: hypothetical protein KDA05_11825 [Phycisphaerales bacterium]|nr:hypothetical protein [Phycisphaerales bacterium]MCB9840537.1 hypothetical protein [Phycisphaeraceae bacterium]